MAWYEEESIVTPTECHDWGEMRESVVEHVSKSFRKKGKHVSDQMGPVLRHPEAADFLQDEEKLGDLLPTASAELLYFGWGGTGWSRGGV